MPVNFQRLRAGQRWRVTQATADAIFESAENWARHARDADPPPPPAYSFEGTIVQVVNNSGSTFMRFSACDLSSTPPILPAGSNANLSEFQNFPRFQVTTPGSNTLNLCIIVEPIPSGGIGLAVVTGAAPVQIKLAGSGPAPTCAGVVNGQPYLQPAGNGLAVLWCDSYSNADGNGLVWAYVLLGAANPCRLAFGKTTAGVHASDSSFTVDHITTADSLPAITTSTSDTLTIENWAGWQADASGRQCMLSLTAITGTPGSGSNLGTGQFVQGGCWPAPSS